MSTLGCSLAMLATVVIRVIHANRVQEIAADQLNQADSRNGSR